MAWNNNSVEPKQSCPIIDSVISDVDDAIKNAEEISNTSEGDTEVKLAESITRSLLCIESQMENIRDINKTLREQREYYKDKIDEIEDILN